jgi:DNA mismatch endonuclease (patch repair protein)
MADIVSADVRSRMMSGIRGKNTQPELIIRHALFSRGFRYRLHDKSLPGKPDLVLTKYRVAVFVNGCFWHHHTCLLFKWPGSNREFWHRKITRNEEIDRKNKRALGLLNWRVLTIWECALKGPCKLPIASVVDKAVAFVNGDCRRFQVAGTARRKS